MPDPDPEASLSTQLSQHRTSLSDVRSHLANERTHLAYLRTAVSLMSFGITLNRFSIYLEQSGSHEHIQSTRFLLRDAANVGWGLVVLGTALLIWALLRYRRVYRQIVEVRFQPDSLSVTLLTLAVVLLGAISAAWLISS